MKAKFTFVMLTLLAAFNLPPSTAFAQGTAFTYQGRLNDAANPASGIYDLRFALYDAAGSGAQQGVALTNTATAVSNGLFTVTLDFGNQFPGGNRWLEIGVRTNGGGAFATLSPRQKLTATPYAITAGNVTGVIPGGSLSGVYSSRVTLNNPANVVAGAFSGNGAGLTNIDAASLGGLTPANFWRLGGNNVTAGQFLGSTNDQPVEIWVNNRRAVRLESNTNSPNFTGGSSNNFILGSYGSFIGGGGADSSYYTGPSTNSIFGGEFSVIGGGGENTMKTAGYSFIGGGEGNIIDNFQRWAAIAGGVANQIGSTTRVAVAISSANGNFIGGGGGSWIRDGIAGGAIAGGINHSIGPGADYSFIGGGNFNVIFGGATNAVIAGGAGNWIQTNAYGSTIAGGAYHRVQTNAQFATIAGGLSNTVAGAYAFAAGRRAKANHPGGFVWADSQDADFNSSANNQFLIRAAGGVGINSTDTAGAALAVNGGIKVFSGSTMEFGAGVAGKEVNAGKIGYQSFTAGSLDIVGAGTSTSDRKIKFYCEGGATFTGPITAPSDRNLKQDFQPLDAREVLAKVAALPIQSWAYKYDASKRHIGPVAQDFQAAFGLNGGDDKNIATIDADGVALAAIQGLNQKLEQKETEIHELKQRLERLERLVENQIPAR